MRVLEVEVVVRPVKVGENRRAGIEAVLPAIGVREDEEHLLRQAVWRVGVLRVAIPEVFFFERNRCDLGVCADRADGDELLHAEATRVLHELEPHDGVVIKEAPGVRSIGADATYHRRQMHDDLRSRPVVEPRDVVGLAEVVIP